MNEEQDDHGYEYQVEMAEDKRRAESRRLDRRDGVPVHWTEDAQEGNADAS